MVISPSKARKLVLIHPVVVVPRFELRDWRSFVQHFRSGQSTVSGPKWTEIDHLGQNGPSRKYQVSRSGSKLSHFDQNGRYDHFGPVRLPTVPRPLLNIRPMTLCGTAEWPVRVDRVRWTLAIGDWRFGSSRQEMNFRGAPSTVKNSMTSSGRSWNFHTSKKGNGTNRTGGSTILKLVWGGNICFIVQGLEISNRTKPGNSEFALRAFPGCFQICSGFRSGNA